MKRLSCLWVDFRGHLRLVELEGLAYSGCAKVSMASELMVSSCSNRIALPADALSVACTMYSKRPFEDIPITNPNTYDQPAFSFFDSGPNIAKYLKELTEQTFARFE